MKHMYYNKDPAATKDLFVLACGPDQRVNHYTGCIVNGLRFHAKSIEVYRKTQNSGIVTLGT